MSDTHKTKKAVIAHDKHMRLYDPPNPFDVSFIIFLFLMKRARRLARCPIARPDLFGEWWGGVLGDCVVVIAAVASLRV